MRKNPKHDLKFQYRKILEAAAVISLLLIIALMMVFKKFSVDVEVRAVDAPPIQVEDIPITRTVKKVEVPRKPTILVDDPEVDPAEDVDIPVFDIFDPNISPPPPPPPEEQEVVPFFKVERKPELIGGQQAIPNYIRKNNLFPKTAADLGIPGVVIIDFIVDIDGTTKDVKVFQERPEKLGFGEAGIAVMKAMRFTPGMQRDRPVMVNMRQTINFTID